MDESLKQVNKIQKGLVIVTGIPASGKSYFAKELCQKLQAIDIKSKIFSTDNLEAFLYENPLASIDQIKQMCLNKEWDLILGSFLLDKQNFDQKTWNLSRKNIQNPQIIDLLLQSCSMLIIQDELTLRSQRKPFKKYCFQRKVKFLEIQIKVTLQEAYFNNEKRGILSPKSKIAQQIIKKSFQKYEHNEDSIVLDRKRMKQFLEFKNFYSCIKNVQIKDNYSEYLLKKSIQHEFTEKQIDENEIRKRISLIMKDEKESEKYFKNPISNKDKALILNQAKKLYIERKRKISFIQVVYETIQKKILKNQE